MARDTAATSAVVKNGVPRKTKRELETFVTPDGPALKGMIQFAHNYAKHDIPYVVSGDIQKLRTVTVQWRSKAIGEYYQRCPLFSPLLELLRCRVSTNREDEEYQRRLVKAIIMELNEVDEYERGNPYWYPRSLHRYAYRTYEGMGHSGSHRLQYASKMRKQGERPYALHILCLGECITRVRCCCVVPAYKIMWVKDWDKWFECLRTDSVKAKAFSSALKRHDYAKHIAITPEMLAVPAQGKYRYL